MSSHAGQLSRSKSSDFPAKIPTLSGCSRREGGTGDEPLRLIIVFVALRGRNGIGTGQPAVQIDVAATLGAERF